MAAFVACCFHRHHRGKVLTFADVVDQVEEFDAAVFEVLDQSCHPGFDRKLAGTEPDFQHLADHQTGRQDAADAGTSPCCSGQ